MTPAVQTAPVATTWNTVADQVWQIYPQTRGVRVYTNMEVFTESGENDVVDGGTLLPGFSLPVCHWLERAGQRQAL